MTTQPGQEASQRRGPLEGLVSVGLSRKEAPQLTQCPGERCQAHQAQRSAMGAGGGDEAKEGGRKRKERIKQKRKTNRKRGRGGRELSPSPRPKHGLGHSQGPALNERRGPHQTFPTHWLLKPGAPEVI